MADPVVHFEIISSDAPTLHRFYSSVFGWRIAADNPFGYGMVDTRTPGRGINGGIGAPMQGGHGHFTVYVQVSNIDSALSRVITEGGRIALPKTTVPNGPTMAQFFDPAGHLVGLIEGVTVPENVPRARPAVPQRPTPAKPAVQAQSTAKPAAAAPKPAPQAKPKVKAVAKPKAKAAAKPKPKSKAAAKPKAKAKPAKAPKASPRKAAAKGRRR